jgi:hypothetical protein
MNWSIEDSINPLFLNFFRTFLKKSAIRIRNIFYLDFDVSSQFSTRKLTIFCMLFIVSSPYIAPVAPFPPNAPVLLLI